MQKKSLNIIVPSLPHLCHLWWLHSYKTSDVNIFKFLLLSLISWLQMLFPCKYSFVLCYFLWPSPFPSAFLLSMIDRWNFRLPKLNMNTQYSFSKISVPFWILYYSFLLKFITNTSVILSTLFPTPLNFYLRSNCLLLLIVVANILP